MPSTSPARTWKLHAFTRGEPETPAHVEHDLVGRRRARGPGRAARPCGRPSSRPARRAACPPAGRWRPCARPRAPSRGRRSSGSRRADARCRSTPTPSAASRRTTPNSVSTSPSSRIDGRLVHDQQPHVARQRAGDRDDLLRGRAQRAHVHVGRDVAVVEPLEQRRRLRAHASRGRAARAGAARGPGTRSRRRAGPRRGRAPGRSSPTPRAMDSDGSPTGSTSPSTRISPSVGATTPDTHLISVDLPAPFGPEQAVHLPGAHVEVHALQGAHSRVLLRDPADLEQRRALAHPVTPAASIDTSTQRSSRADVSTASVIRAARSPSAKTGRPSADSPAADGVVDLGHEGVEAVGVALRMAGRQRRVARAAARQVRRVALDQRRAPRAGRPTATRAPPG